MKKSKYNHIRKSGSQYTLYNARTEAISVLDNKVAELYVNKEPGSIKEIHPEFYDHLVGMGFLIENDTDETAGQIEQWRMTDSDTRSFSVSVNPTLNCNMCCWYCYESHSGDLSMKPEVTERVKRLISEKMAETELEQFHLGFFGGEPLLNFDQVCRKLIDHACEEGSRHGKRVSTSFVTNGYLLSEDILEYLESKNIHVSFQITLDGNEETHDSIRYPKAGGKSYRRILDNASRVLGHKNMDLVMRCNFTSTSLPTFIDVASDLAEWKDNNTLDLSRMKVDLHQVWQDKGNADRSAMKPTEEEVRKVFREENVPVTIVQRANRYRCYADRNNSMLVNYNGDLYRCTARDFTPESREGILNEEGKAEWNEKSEARDNVKWNNTTCLECNIFPLCCGCCSQSKLESGRTTGCDYGYTAEDKEDIVTERIKWLLSRSEQ